MASLHYFDSSRVHRDVTMLLRQIPSLSPSSSRLIANDGSSSNVLLLTGTVPIYFQGNQYNIPVDTYVPLEYPQMPPIAFVRPTGEMMIKPDHPNVQPDTGLLRYDTIDYLKHWNGNDPN